MSGATYIDGTEWPKLPDPRWPEGEAPVILERVYERRRQLLMVHRTAHLCMASIIDKSIDKRLQQAARFDLLGQVRERHHRALTEKLPGNWPIEETGRVLDRENWDKDFGAEEGVRRTIERTQR